MTYRLSHRPLVSGNYVRLPDTTGLVAREPLVPIVEFEPMFGVPEPGYTTSPAFAAFDGEAVQDRYWMALEDLQRLMHYNAIMTAGG